MGCCKHKNVIILTTLVFLFLTIGILSMSLWSTVYNKILVRELTITNDSTGYKMWQETPVPMYLNVFLFNWSNAEEVIDNNWSIKPRFEELGPYVFSEHHIRTNLTWINDNQSVIYYQKRIWKFIPELSNGNLSDKVTNVNVVAVAASYLVRKQGYPVKKILSFLLGLKEKSLILTKTVDEWLFTGYKDSLLELIASLNLPIFSSVTSDRFGWFFGRNNSETYDGNFTMFTGSNDIELLGIINEWNGKPYSPYFNDYCAFVNGTSGELWPPVEKYDLVDIFAPDLCSSVRLQFQDSYKEFFGIRGKKYAATDFDFDNGTKYPEQKCFITDQTYPSGVRDISKCKFGAPAFVSYPHFYLADPFYANSVDGMHPNKTAHEFYIILEPNTGVPLEARAALQLNLLIQPISGISMFKKVKKTFMPMVYFTQTALLSKPLAKEAKMLLTLPSVMLYTGGALVGIALLGALAGIYITCNRAWTTREEENRLLDGQQNNVQQ
ncbi:protein croquemort-like [Onthophagus taurus]|uniref:protein croquemort-like n=1 Tax=Onthophagus taurus TaxID=166361 RepID=UPI000C209FF4|nr:protein croquemort-like [Onthophagus taurus]XP_022912791.1 protein croquemort-like [Onthophagus taurus]